jgi:hypothetical protein
VKSFSTIAIVALMAGALAGCAYKPLKAPCSPDEGGVPLAYSGMLTPAVPDAFKSIDRCGPMRPI